MAEEIENCEQLRAAIKAHDGDRDRQRYLLKRAIDLGCVEDIPDEWGIEAGKNG